MIWLVLYAVGALVMFWLMTRPHSTDALLASMDQHLVWGWVILLSLLWPMTVILMIERGIRGSR